jgi:tetrapyrrole methylase family protein/MazG family protein
MKELNALVDVMKRLRGPNGCPWDHEQTHETLAPYAIEEVYELVEAIESKNLDPLARRQSLIEELGDLLFQVVFHSEIARQNNEFDISDVIESITKKMIFRHPHVFETADPTQKVTTQEVLDNWTLLKSKEKKQVIGFGIPRALPSLQRAQKIGEKTKKLNFDWTEIEQVKLKLQEELNELNAAIQSRVKTEIESEMGDVLFTLAQLSRHLEIEAETALRKTNDRFESRFETMQKIAKEKSLEWSKLSTSELEELWQSSKQRLKNQENL